MGSDSLLVPGSIATFKRPERYEAWMLDLYFPLKSRGRDGGGVGSSDSVELQDAFANLIWLWKWADTGHWSCW